MAGEAVAVAGGGCSFTRRWVMPHPAGGKAVTAAGEAVAVAGEAVAVTSGGCSSAR